MQIFVKFSPNFFGISQNFSDFDRSDVKMMIFHKNLRKIAEIIRNFLAKFLKICPKKMYTLNRYGGNTVSAAQSRQDRLDRRRKLRCPGIFEVLLPRVRA